MKSQPNWKYDQAGVDLVQSVKYHTFWRHPSKAVICRARYSEPTPFVVSQRMNLYMFA